MDYTAQLKEKRLVALGGMSGYNSQGIQIKMRLTLARGNN